MNDVLQAINPAWSVKVTGALGANGYTGDGHVVGVGDPLISATLGTTEGAQWLGGALVDAASNPMVADPSNSDSFIVNDAFGGADRITMIFNFDVAKVSFDYEIFPNGSCPDFNWCVVDVDWPGFTFRANGVQKLFRSGIVPGQDGTPLTSPISAPDPELAPQFLGLSGTLDLGTDGLAGAPFEFIDWPVMIGIDNLTLTIPDRRDVPAPRSILLLGIAWCALAIGRAVRPWVTPRGN